MELTECKGKQYDACGFSHISLHIGFSFTSRLALAGRRGACPLCHSPTISYASPASELKIPLVNVIGNGNGWKWNFL